MSTRERAWYLTGELGVALTPGEAASQVIGRMAARYGQRLPLLPGAVDAVTVLAAHWPLGLASSSPRSLIGVALDAAGLRACFAVTMSAEASRLRGTCPGARRWPVRGPWPARPAPAAVA